MLTIVCNGDGSSGGEDGVGSEGGSSFRYVFHLDTGEGRTSALSIGNGKFVGRALGQETAWIIQNLQRLCAGVGNGSRDFEVLDAMDALRAYKVEEVINSLIDVLK